MDAVASADFGPLRPLFPQVVGVILAGGRSSRMGRDKSGLPVGPELLLMRQLRILEESGVGRRLVSAGEHSAGEAWERIPSSVERLVDLRPGLGPMAGIERALHAARRGETHLLVLAVDLPRVSAPWLWSLLAACSAGVGVVGSREGQLEPLAAVYPIAAWASAQRCLTRGDLSVQRWVRVGLEEGWMRERVLGPDDSAELTNWNRPEDCDG